MPKHIRRKPPVVAVKASKRRGSDSSLSSLSDDTGYSAVDEISDSDEEDERNVHVAEEEHIIAQKTRHVVTSPRSESDEDDGDDAEDELDDEDDDDEEDEEDADEEGDDDDDDDEEAIEDDDDYDTPNPAEARSWNGIVSDVDDTTSDGVGPLPPALRAAQIERHVRFVDVPDSDSDSTDTDDDHADFFPDIFVAQSSLDPAFRRELEVDPDDSSSTGSYWDYNGTYEMNPMESDMDGLLARLSEDNTPVATPAAPQELPSDLPTPTPIDVVQELDGYETDGETTEEDVPEPPAKRKTRRPLANDLSDSELETPVKSSRGQPRVGRFNLDKSDRKPIAVVNPITRKMMIFTPGHRRRQLDLSPEQFNFQFNENLNSSPILSNSASLMMSAMFSSNTFGDIMHGQSIGPAEAFFPFFDPVTTDDSLESGVDVEEDEAEKSLDIGDFITFEEGASDDENEAEKEWNGLSDPCPTPTRPTTASSEGDVLTHLTSETVGAFRRNQVTQQLMMSTQVSQDSLVFSGPYNYTALRGIKSDRFDTAGVPLTPMRRRKDSVHDLPTSPLEALSQKRKASSDHNFGHKRHRSISDVNLLRI